MLQIVWCQAFKLLHPEYSSHFTLRSTSMRIKLAVILWMLALAGRAEGA
jgi:hypothetical protein